MIIKDDAYKTHIIENSNEITQIKTDNLSNSNYRIKHIITDFLGNYSY